MEKKKVKIGLVDDHRLFRDGIKYIIERNSNYTVLFEANNGREFIDLLLSVDPDVVLLDIEMPVLNGVEAAQEALKLKPDLKIIVLSMFGEQQYYQQMISIGVKGFILKDAGKNELERAIEDVLNGQNYFSQELLKNIIANIPKEDKSSILTEALSKRETEVLQQICKGLSNNEIADQLFISPKTVEGHKAKLMAKTQTKNTVSLVMFSIKHNIIQVP